jgi:flagellar basal body-associated protein FliL
MLLLPIAAAACMCCACCVLFSSSADAQPEDAALQHQRAKEMLQLTEWMAAVGQGHKDMLVRVSVYFNRSSSSAGYVRVQWQLHHVCYKVLIH